MSETTYLVLTALGTLLAAWLTDRIGAAYLDLGLSGIMVDGAILDYCLTLTWDPRCNQAVLLVCMAVVIAAMTYYTGREERILKREVRGREFGDARWAERREWEQYAHLATTRKVYPPENPKGFLPAASELRAHPRRFVASALGWRVSVPSPIPEWFDKEQTVADDNIILSESARLQLSKIPDPLLERNKHVYVLGGSGSGKTFNFVGPNLLQLYGSYVVTDPKGDTVKQYANFFKNHGYKVKVVNLKSSEIRYSLHYNPLLYITGATSILTLVNLLVENTSGDGGESASSNQDFFVKAEKQLYMALIGYLYYAAAGYPEEQTFVRMIELLQLAKDDKGGYGSQSTLDCLIDMAPPSGGRNIESGRAKYKNSFREQLIRKYGSEAAARQSDEWFVITQYRGFKATAKSPETEASIISSCNVRMAPFSVGDVKRFFSSDELELDRIGEERTAFFLVMSDTDSTFNFILAMLLYQLFDLNTSAADANPGSHCKIPVMCILDELANIGKIPDLDIKIATLRSRWINLCPILQNSTQLKKWYKDNASVIEGNCDTMLYLGRCDEETNEKISKQCGKRTIPVRSDSISHGSHGSWSNSTNWQAADLMSQYDLGHNPEAFAGDECLVFIKSARPVKDRKYKTTSHPRYHELQRYGQFSIEEYGAELDRTRRGGA